MFLCEPSVIPPEKTRPHIDREVTIANSSKGIYRELDAERRGRCVAQKPLFLHGGRPITAGLMWMQIAAKVASPCHVVSERVLCEPLAQPQLGKKPRWQRPAAEYTDVPL